MKLIVVISLMSLSLCAFDIKTIDETKEGLKKAKENTIARDGKIIYKPMTKVIIGAAEKNIAEAIENIVKAIDRNIATPIPKKIIYPVGTQHIAEPKKEISQKPEPKKSSFASGEELQQLSNEKAVEVEVDKFFDGIKETNSSDKIKPINIE